MIIGIGIDIVGIPKIKDTILRTPGFIVRIFTKCEINYCEDQIFRLQHYAARFAAKEAVVKAIGHTSFIPYKDIEIIRSDGQAPLINLKGVAKELAEQKGVKHCHISLTHTETYAAAVAVMED